MTVDKLLANTSVGELMSREVQTVLSGTSLQQALRQMVEANVGSLVVIKQQSDIQYLNNVKGLVPVFFALRRFLEPDGGSAVTDEAMFTDYITARDSDRIAEVLKNITSNKTWRMLVTDSQDRVVGLLSATDILVAIRNVASGNNPICIGVDSSYHHLNLHWHGDTLVMTRQGEFVAKFPQITGIQQEYARLAESEQDILLLRLDNANGQAHVLFIDNDPVQTNVRLVSDQVTRLADVYAWLLPQDFVHRQGDVGIYLRNELPPDVEEVSADDYPDQFIDILSKRHAFDPPDACRFYVSPTAHYVMVRTPARLIHPEHHAQPLAPALYQLIGARGTPLPEFVGLREGESAELKG